MSRPASLVRSRPRLFLPRLACSMSTATLPLNPAMPVEPEPAGGVTAGDVLDLDHLRTPVGEDAGRGGHEGVLGDLEDADAFHHVRHGAGAYACRRPLVAGRDRTVGSFPICKNVVSAPGATEPTRGHRDQPRRADPRQRRRPHLRAARDVRGARARQVPRPGAARRRGGRRRRAVVVRRPPWPEHRAQRRGRQVARVLQPRRVALRRDASRAASTCTSASAT